MKILPRFTLSDSTLAKTRRLSVNFLWWDYSPWMRKLRRGGHSPQFYYRSMSCAAAEGFRRLLLVCHDGWDASNRLSLQQNTSIKLRNIAENRTEAPRAFQWYKCTVWTSNYTRFQQLHVGTICSPVHLLWRSAERDAETLRESSACVNEIQGDN